MTSPVAAFLDSLVGGVERGTAFRQQRDDRRLVLSEHADDRQYEQARRLREGVAAGLEGKILQYQADHLGEPSPVRLNPGETLHDPTGRLPDYTAPGREPAPRAPQMVRNSRGVYVPIDPETGFDPQGRQVRGYDPPRDTGPTPYILKPGMDGKVVAVDPRNPGAQPIVVPGVQQGSGQAGARTLPAAIVTKVLDMRGNLRKVEEGLAAVNAHPEAFGMQNYVPGYSTYADQAGNQYRQAVADLGSMIIHDRSGAAVTASEQPRLKPFIPAATDPPRVVKDKLTRFKQVLNEMESDYRDYYQSQGFAVPGGGAPAGIAAPSPSGVTAQERAALKAQGYEDDEIDALDGQ